MYDIDREIRVMRIGNGTAPDPADDKEVSAADRSFEESCAALYEHAQCSYFESLIREKGKAAGLEIERYALEHG
jgi:hypothetical protein